MNLENEVLIDRVVCYAFKVESKPDGSLRIYAFNARDKGGDTEIVVEGKWDRLKIRKETEEGVDEILAGRLENPSLRDKIDPIP